MMHVVYNGLLLNHDGCQPVSTLPVQGSQLRHKPPGAWGEPWAEAQRSPMHVHSRRALSGVSPPSPCTTVMCTLYALTFNLLLTNASLTQATAPNRPLAASCNDVIWGCKDVTIALLPRT